MQLKKNPKLNFKPSPESVIYDPHGNKNLTKPSIDTKYQKKKFKTRQKLNYSYNCKRVIKTEGKGIISPNHLRG